ncbi:MAG: DNA ligase D [Gemmatimonadota bacterium]|nr:DNA ligase D [Gemmatimonadota bacterium]
MATSRGRTRAKAGAGRKLTEYRRKRDFGKTAEPSGEGVEPNEAQRGIPQRGRRSGASLRFVIQKHAARNLHFDLRLELDGVMKSWAVPKGPSLDPGVKRLAMEVEDHPIAYNTFEGTIPAGEYGGGTVMLWDRGGYEPTDGGAAEALRSGYDRGKLDITLHGERLAGGFTLVRTRRGDAKPQWLLIKRKDEHADPGGDIVAEVTASVESGRTMEQIAEGKSRVWRSNRARAGSKKAVVKSSARKAPRATAKEPAPPSTALAASLIEPMYASVGTTVPRGDGWTFEPKYDGIRVLAFVAPGSGAGQEAAVSLVTRNGKNKAEQFPEIADALKALVRRSRRPLVLDGEIVALRGDDPGRFQHLQARMHVREAVAIERHAEDSPAAYVAFDVLMDGAAVLLDEPWTARRNRLERRLGAKAPPRIRLGESSGDGEALLREAARAGWEGVIAKRVDAPYVPGARSRDWLKLKIEHRQELVVGGFTEPRNSRQFIGALLLGYFDGDRLIYAGHTGGGFTRDGLRAMHRRLAPLERKTSPFTETPKTNERPHWVRPEVVVEVKFNEWTADGKLRQPIFLGMRDDKDAREVTRERASVQPVAEAKAPATARKRSATRRIDGTSRKRGGDTRSRGGAPGAAEASSRRTGFSPPPGPPVSDQLDAIERAGGDGALQLPDGATLQVSSLGKVFFPKSGFTKGDVMRYYARMAAVVLPPMADRPLVLRRFPNGIAGQAFYQQKAPDAAPPGVRIQALTSDGDSERRFVAGDLATLLYTVQLGTISVDPWHARIDSLDTPDYTIVDLDPGPQAPFPRVVKVALWVKEEIDTLGLRAALKTSGSRGLHVYIPLPAGTPSDAALLVAQIIATRVADRHPSTATTERSVKARPAAAVYVDYLQNIRGKTVAAAYCVRARDGATVSTPLAWDELTSDLDPQEFTIDTVPARVLRLGDVWAKAMRRPSSLQLVTRAAKG